MKEVSLLKTSYMMKKFENSTMKGFGLNENESYVESKECANQIPGSVFIQVDNTKEDQQAFINKVGTIFSAILDLALQSETLKTILNDDELRIVLIDSKITDARFYTRREGMKFYNNSTIFIKSSFDIADDNIDVATLYALIYEASNFSNISIFIPNLLMPLVNDKDLHGLITEFTEYSSNFTANKILNEIAADTEDDEQVHIWSHDFIENWCIQNGEREMQPSHTEGYRLAFSVEKSNSSAKTSKELTKGLNIDFQSNQKLFESFKKFVTNFPSTVEKMYQQKVPNLPDRKVFDEFVLKLKELINADKVLVENEDHESETKISRENTSQEVKETKLPEYDLFLAEDKEKDIELSGDDLFTQVSVKVDYDPCTLF